MAKELVQAQIAAGQLSPEKMHEALQATHQNLISLQASETAATDQATSPPVDWKQSIARHTITCLECGATFKQLSVRHLSQHDLDPRLYREKYGIPRTQPLSAKSTTAMRKKIVQASRPWEKAPTYMKSKQGQESEKPSSKAPAKKKGAARKKTG